MGEQTNFFGELERVGEIRSPRQLQEVRANRLKFKQHATSGQDRARVECL